MYGIRWFTVDTFCLYVGVLTVDALVQVPIQLCQCASRVDSYKELLVLLMLLYYCIITCKDRVLLVGIEIPLLRD